MDASSVLSDDLSDYDVISDPGLESSIGDLGESSPLYEPQPADAAIARFVTPSLSADSIQLYVAQYLEGSVQKPFRYRRVRVYVDGIFDPLGVASVCPFQISATRADLILGSNALQLRQAKLSFPAVHLMVGVFSDLDCELNGIFPTTTHAERCELVRHCRWVDEVISEVPWQLDETFASDKKIDYVAIDEGITVDPRCDKLRVRGYDKMKGLGMSLHQVRPWV